MSPALFLNSWIMYGCLDPMTTVRPPVGYSRGDQKSHPCACATCFVRSSSLQYAAATAELRYSTVLVNAPFTPEEVRATSLKLRIKCLGRIMPTSLFSKNLKLSRACHVHATFPLSLLCTHTQSVGRRNGPRYVLATSEQIATRCTYVSITWAYLWSCKSTFFIAVTQYLYPFPRHGRCDVH